MYVMEQEVFFGDHVARLGLSREVSRDLLEVLGFQAALDERPDRVGRADGGPSGETRNAGG